MSDGIISTMPRLSRYAWFVLGYNLAVILWGAMVRATGSGAGCGSHWPLCNGEVLPRAPALETLIEFSHRLTSGMALLLVLGLLVGAVRSFPKGHATRFWAWASFAFILGEAAVGAGLVLFELVADNQSVARALFMGSHLINTFLLLGALTLTAFHAGAPQQAEASPPQGGATKPVFAAALLGMLLVGASGAVAALGDTLFPARSLAQALAQDVSPTAHALIRLRVLHPFLSIGVGTGLLVLAWRTLRHDAAGLERRYAVAVMGLVAAQTLVGFANVTLLAPIPLQIVHLLLADLLWIALVLLAASSRAGLAAVGAARSADVVATRA